MRRIWSALLAAPVVLALSLSPALAARPEHVSEPIDDTFDDTVCGVPVTVHVTGRNTFNVFADGSVRDTSRIHLTFTNAEGDWVVNDVAGPALFETIDDGSTTTFRSTIAGIPQRLRTSEGITEAFDRGRIVFTTVVDNDTGDVLGEDVEVAGPHPEADAGFVLFCEVIVDTLG
jgi:hypothetical protein